MASTSARGGLGMTLTEAAAGATPAGATPAGATARAALATEALAQRGE